MIFLCCLFWHDLDDEFLRNFPTHPIFPFVKHASTCQVFFSFLIFKLSSQFKRRFGSEKKINLKFS